jgi:hypothetical protein
VRWLSGWQQWLRQVIAWQSLGNLPQHGRIFFHVALLLLGKAQANGAQFIDRWHVFHGSISNN